MPDLQESTNILQLYINKHLTFFPRLYFSNSVLVLKYMYLYIYIYYYFKALGCRCDSSVPISPTPKLFLLWYARIMRLKEVMVIKLILTFQCKITLSPYINIDSSTQFDVNDFFTRKHKSFNTCFYPAPAKSAQLDILNLNLTAYVPCRDPKVLKSCSGLCKT